jgi:DNA-directed RNA polymerase subunit RPC12/RpoP
LSVTILKSGRSIVCSHCGFNQKVKPEDRSFICSHCNQLVLFMPTEDMVKAIETIAVPVDSARYSKLRHDWVETEKNKASPHYQDFVDLFGMLESLTSVIEKKDKEISGLRDLVGRK